MATNKKILNQGIKYLAWALPALFIGPTAIHFAFINKLQPLYPVILGVGIIVSICGMYLIFKGVLTIIKSIFND